MRVETLCAPGGREIEPYVCPLCFLPFEALFLYWSHIRRVHNERPAPLGGRGVD